jgi:Ala-tRNA(Pro) deacylase
MTSEGLPRGLKVITAFLEEQGIEFEVVEHDRTTTARAEARAAGVSPDHVAKTIALRDEAVFLLAVIPASRRLDLDKTRHALGASAALRFATEDEMRSEFDVFEAGALAPLPDIVRTTEVVDERLLEPERILFSGGDHTHGVLMDPHDLIEIVQPKVADVCAD